MVTLWIGSPPLLDGFGIVHSLGNWAQQCWKFALRIAV